MTPAEFTLMAKNQKQWKARIAKLETMEERRGRKLTEAEVEELPYRVSMLAVWDYQLKHASPGGEDAPGSMSASSSAKTGSKAGVSSA